MNKIFKRLEDSIVATKQKKKKEEEEETKQAIQKEAEQIVEWIVSKTDRMYDFKNIYISLKLPSSVEKRTLVMYGNPRCQKYRDNIEIRIGDCYESDEDTDIVIAALKYLIKYFKANNCIIKEKLIRDRELERFAVTVKINWKN